MFVWTQFLEQHRIAYVTDHSEFNATLRCPFCGEADHAGHDLAISLRGRGWKCWRNTKHRGRSNARLIQAFLRCSWARAKELAGETQFTASVPDAIFLDRVAMLLHSAAPPPKRTPFWPQEFKPLNDRGLGAPFWDYMVRRGYTDAQLVWLTEHYSLRYAVSGRFSYRIIIPVFDLDGRLATWTGRTIQPDKEPRYKTLSTEPFADEATALCAPGDLLLGLPLLQDCPNPNVLVVTEGPLDAFRVSVFGHRRGVYGTCLFGLNPTEQQAELLEVLTARFNRLRLVLDADASFRAFAIRNAFNTVPMKVVRLPHGVKDPGELTESQALQLVATLAA